MKKALQKLALLTAILIADFNIISAQTILNITKMPASPTTNDTITFIADCRFSSGNCDPYIMNLSYGGNNVYASALHCLGVLSFICSYADTFKIPPLAAGSYNFIFHLEAGYGFSCTPGIVAGPTDTLPFVVSSTTGVIENVVQSPYFLLTPNPSDGTINIQIAGLFDNDISTELEFFNLSGEKVASCLITQRENRIKTNLCSGVYLCRFKNNPSSVQKLVIIN